ncbi:MAG: hypothetical protein ACRDA3_14465 [Peptostreptococcaceae bacterium]
MANPKKAYKPSQNALSALTTATVIKTMALTTDQWSLALLQGIAKAPAGTMLPSAAVLLWPTTVSVTAQSVTNAYAITFSDYEGRYGVTIKTGTAYRIKVYG